MRPYTSAFASRNTACFSLAISFLTLLIPAPVAYTQQIEIKLISLTSPVSPGNDATIVVKTAANANCQITVHYKSGPSKAQGLFPKSADNQGQVSWTWRVGSNTTPGQWPITVTCSAGGVEGTLKTAFVVL